ncbi:hypothetical protein [Virgibacillus sp. Bac332]|uniref:hypothetical protein n=1 Tax=Virgibacillus sp. Bac332 TaxID=2419842 RepID=UPI000EF46970|nr:hypothetical protein [Virgibacillus sp. Bac332]
MKKRIKRLFIKENGSVSIYMIIIIMPIFLLNALLIDTLRILSAEREIENAMDTALRSTMAAFNTDLASVGLFAYGGDGNVSEAFNGYVNDQFYDGGLGGYQNLTSPTIEKATANPVSDRNLVDLDVFEHQILESMKYQAPAQIGEELFNLIGSSKFQDLTTEQVENAKELSENFEQIIEWSKKRNEKIDIAIKEIKNYREIFEYDIPKNIIGDPVRDDSKEIKIPSGIETFEELIFYHDRFQELKGIEERSDSEQTEFDNYKGGINYHIAIDNYLQVLADKEIRNALVGMGGSLTSPKEKSAKWYNDKIRKLFNSTQDQSLDSLKTLFLEPKFFEDIITSMDEINNQLDIENKVALKEATERMDFSVFTINQLIFGFYLTIEEHKSIAKKIMDTIKAKNQDIFNTQISAIDTQLDEYYASKKQLDSEKFNEAEDEANTSFSSLLEIFSDAEEFGDDQGVYDDLGSIMEKYDAISSDGDTSVNDDRLGFISDAFNRFNEFVNFVQGFPEKFRNQMYINEYILANYGTKISYELDDPDSYLFRTKQAQFITYGHLSTGTNYLMFIKDIVIILFVVNLIEQITTKGGFAGPVGFLKAISVAFGDTVLQIGDITTGNYTLKWTPFNIPPVDMTMPMFMRIVMLMRSTTGETYNNNKLRRLQAVVTKETGVYLNKASTYIEGDIDSKIKLWFIPALTELLPNNFGNVNGSYYEINKTKVYSY